MARVRRARLSILDDDTLMLPFEWAESRPIAAEPVIVPVATPAPFPFRRPAPRPMPATPFGTWLLAQTRTDGWIGDLAKAANADRGFPRRGDGDAVRERLSSAGAEADMIEAVDIAERAWLGS